MTSLFNFPSGAANPIAQVITGTGATNVDLGQTASPGSRIVPLFRVSEIAGGTANLTVEIYNGTDRFYLGSGGFTWKAKALTAGQSLLFDDGYVIPQNSVLRITCSVGSNVVVTGVYIGRQNNSNWRPGAGV